MSAQTDSDDYDHDGKLKRETVDLILAVEQDDRIDVLDYEIEDITRRASVKFAVRELNSNLDFNTEFENDGKVYAIGSIGGEHPFATFTVSSEAIL